MIRIFYKRNGQIECCQSEMDFRRVRVDEVLWIDLQDPEGKEKKATEAFLGAEIQSRAQAEEIESSSRFFEKGNAIYANINYLTPAGDEYSSDPVSFTIVGDVLATLREVPLRSFNSLQNKMMARPNLFKSGFSVFTAILDQRVDLDADIVEILSKDTAHISKRITQQEEDINEDMLLDINQLQENTMMLRENVVDKQRLISNLLKSDNCPEEIEPKLNVLLQDIASLINHTNFNFERLEYLQETVVGLISLDQNRTMKLLTFISFILMPATFIASFYGMNVHLPMESVAWAWAALLLLMALLTVGIWIVFKRKNLL